MVLDSCVVDLLIGSGTNDDLVGELDWVLTFGCHRSKTEPFFPVALVGRDTTGVGEAGASN